MRELAVNGVPCPILALPDRRGGKTRSKEWMFTRSVEAILYGPSQVCANPLS